ncbi:cytochrome c oxidase assembly protein [Massilia horti]|nr:cytochrome c oxidase assembly protein [Massilia horti]
MLVTTLSLLMAPGFAWSHAGHGHDAAQWIADPWTSALLLAAAGAYLLGWRRLRWEGNASRVLGRSRIWLFSGGMLVLGIALVSPLDSLADRSLCAHMTQHMLLMLAAPPLLVSGRPLLVWLWAFPLAGRRRIGQAWIGSGFHRTYAFMMRPLVVWTCASIALWLWHIPFAYDLALEHEYVHALEHLCFFATSLAFWTLTLAPYGKRQAGHGAALVMVATFAVHSGLLGALLTFARAPLYPVYAGGTFGLTALEDQQLAGLIMWVPAGAVYLGSMLSLFAGWLGGVHAYGDLADGARKPPV